MDRKNTEELMKMLGLKETLDKMAKANGVRWYGHVVRRDDDSILKKAMMFEVNGPRKRGRPKQTWKKQVEENIKKIGLRVEEATDRARWREEVRAIAAGMRCIRSPLDTRKTGLKLVDDDDDILLLTRNSRKQHFYECFSFELASLRLILFCFTIHISIVFSRAAAL